MKKVYSWFWYRQTGQTRTDHLIIGSCASPSDNLIWLSYLMPTFSANLFRHFNYILQRHLKKFLKILIWSYKIMWYHLSKCCWSVQQTTTVVAYMQKIETHRVLNDLQWWVRYIFNYLVIDLFSFYLYAN